VISLAGADYITSGAGQIIISGLILKPIAANTTGAVYLSILNGETNGTNGIGITDDTSVKVMELVNQSVTVSGTISPATVPLITAGQVAAQPMGVLKLNFIAEPSVNTSSTITFSLDNGAKFHSGATNPISYGYVTDGLASSQVNDAFSVNSSGQLVWTIANPQNEIDANNTFQFNAGSNMIDAIGITANGDITCTIVGTGAFATLNQTIKVATVAMSGVTVAFIDNATTGVSTLSAGTGNQELGAGEYVLVVETAPYFLIEYYAVGK